MTLVDGTITRPTQRGLTAVDAARRLATYGPNTIKEPRQRGVLARATDQLRDPMILLLVGAALITVMLRDVVDLIVISLVIVLNTTVGVIQEVRAERAIAAVRSMAAPTARVIRDGRHLRLPAAELVPGDLVQLDAGDIVPADIQLTMASALQIDESSLTGESVPADKNVGCPAEGTEPEMAHAGTVVVRGRAGGTVARTGAASSLGRIAALIADQPRRPTPLQIRLSDLSRVLTVAALVISGVVLGLGLLRGESLNNMIITAVALAVAAVPESLPAVVTLALALGAHRMARRHAVIRRLPAVETLGSVTVVAADKTGTLTEGRMVAERLWTPIGEYTIGDRHVDAATLPAVAPLLRDIALCNDASLPSDVDAANRPRPVGDPMEAALLAAADGGGIDPEAMRTRYPRVRELPFDSERRRMTTIHVHGATWLTICKGAPDVLLDERHLCHDDHAVIDAARHGAERLAAGGYRVLAVAERVTPLRPADDEAERDLHLVGLVALTDPPRAGAAEVVHAFDTAGVRLMLITGDHPTTATAIAQRLGITSRWPAGAVVTGDDLDAGVPAESLADTTVFARTRPEQKLDIVGKLQDLGHVVAMTGDGVNDGPALRRADIGVAMGRGGTEVARQAADLVLQDDELSTVVLAIEEGRRIYANVRRFLRYALSGGLAEVIVMIVGPFVGLGLPLLPAQILWINMLTHGLPGVAIGAEPAEAAVMRRRPRAPGEFVLGGGLSRQIAWTGSLIAAAVLAVGLWANATGRPWQTLVFVTLGSAQLAVALALRSRAPHDVRISRFLDLAVAGAFLLQLGAVYLPPLRTLVNTESLTMLDLTVALAAAVVPAAIVRVLERHRREMRG